MAWDHLSINKPHLVYIILGGFTTLFMLCSSIIKEKFYIGEATVATICGIIFGPHAADLINPGTWGNTDQITLEFSRIVLVVQCFAVGVELPKAYMERHWRSVLFLLVPVMTFGWLITSLFIWAFFNAHMNWLDSLCIAACVTATDPVLASSVVGKGKFAKRVPKHLRDLLSAESGCNDGMAFPFIYLALYIIRYKNEPNNVALYWFCYTILYECLFGAIYGVAIGYIARRLIRYAHEHDLIDRESFLVFYFVLALFCAGSGSLLGMDDLLVGFAAGVGFSNDGWFTAQTEESHVSNVIDLLINLTFFVYFGTIIPWQQYNAGYLGLDVWRLVVIAILVLFFRRIPIMLALKPLIPDVKTWREALFAGHFGPIGVGAIFIAILARAELETEETTPLAVLPGPDFPHANIIELIWPITTFLVITSIVVHGSSIAVFTLGKHINTLTLTMSYTQANEGNHWTERLPRIASRSKSQTTGQYDSEMDEKEKGLSPADMRPGTFLRRQKEEDNPSHGGSRASSRHRSRRSKNNFENGRGPGGPISQSAIHPNRKDDIGQPISRSDSETLAAKSESPPSTSQGKEDLSPESSKDRDEAQSPGEIYEEGDKTVYEDEEGNVLAVEDTRQEPQDEREKDDVEEGKRLMHKEGADHNHGVAPTKDDPNTDPGHEAVHKAEKAAGVPERPASNWRRGISKAGTLTTLAGLRKKDGEEKPKPEAESKKAHGPARAYQYGNTIIVEDEDGEVIKKYDIPSPDKKTGAGSADADRTKKSMARMGKMLGMGHNEAKATAAGEQPAEGSSKRPQVGRKASKVPEEDEAGDENLRFMLTAGGRRMSKAEFIDSIRGMDPKSRVQMVEGSNAPEAVKHEARSEAREQAALKRSGNASSNVPVVPEHPEEDHEVGNIQRTNSHEGADLKLVDSNDQNVPVHNISDQLKQYSMQSATGETAAERRRRQALEARNQEDSDDDGTERVPPARAGRTDTAASGGEAGETAAERRRREGALGISGRNDSDSEDDDQPRQLPPQQSKNIKFADSAPPPPQQEQQGQSSRQGGIKWGKNVRG